MESLKNFQNNQNPMGKGNDRTGYEASRILFVHKVEATSWMTVVIV